MQGRRYDDWNEKRRKKLWKFSQNNIDFLKEVQSVNYSITDVNGKQIINGTFNNQFNELELSHISQGTYILHVDFNNQKINGTQFFKR